MENRRTRRLIGLAAALGLYAILGSGLTSALAQETAPAPREARRITVAEAKQAFDAGKAVIVDVRSPQDYENEHIAGALSIPSWQVVERSAELPKDKLIITYCT